jgi:SnoaL-like protein
MQTLERIEIERTCERLSVAYARHVDFGEYEAYLALFAEDARLDLGGDVMEGREAIRRFLAQRPRNLRSRHVFTNLMVEVIDADHARGITYLTLYRHVGDESLGAGPIDFPGPAGIGHYEDEYVRTPAGWRFASRKLHLAFRRADSFPRA